MFTLLKNLFSSSAPTITTTTATGSIPPAISGQEMMPPGAIGERIRNAKKQGNALLAEGKLDEAAGFYLQVVATDPRDVEGHINLGYVFGLQKRYEDAAFHLKQAMKIDPSNVDSIFMLGNLSQDQGNDEEAKQYFNDVLARSKDYEIVYRVLLNLKRNEDAIACCDAMLRTKPDYAGAHVNRGIALQAMDRHEEALESYSQALALDSNSATTWLNYGVSLKNLGRHQDELAAYDKAIQLQPDMAEAHFNAGFCRLQLGEFARGWKDHEWRWKTPQLAKAQRQFAQPLWLGKESLKGKTILLHAEQGLGDTIQFCRYAKVVAAQGANVVLLVQQSLKALLSGLAGVSVTISDGDAMPPFDFHCPLLSLPLACGTTLNTIDSTVPYIQVDARSVEKWRAKLGVTSKLKVGLVWSGNANHLNDRNRSIPLANFRALQSERLLLVSLQKEVRATDITTLGELKEIKHFGTALQDFTDTAGLIMNVDLVITVDTSVAHLAGALGKPVWILLPLMSDWRWMHDRSDCPWYPSVTLFRQTAAGRWHDVFERIALQLNALRDGADLDSTLISASHLSMSTPSN